MTDDGFRLDANASRYLDLLKPCLTRDIFIEQEVCDYRWDADEELGDGEAMWNLLRERSLRIVRASRPHGATVPEADWLPTAETMIGMARLDNVQDLVTRALTDETPGDLVETGVWRGGAVILMRALLDVCSDTTRHVWACDSFQGLPAPDIDRYPEDAPFERRSPLDHAINAALAVSIEQVAANFERYGLLDDRVHFLEGWFKDTLPTAPIKQIAVLRIDGDLYQSTTDALVNLEPKVSRGGFVIVDDFNAIDACRKAVMDYRTTNAIAAEITEVDWTAAWWQKP
jgi:hypothetical protein